MTEDMTIKQRPSAMPYLLGGALVGTGAGVVANNTVPQLKGTPMSHEDIIKTIQDKVEFSKKTAEGAEHAASWKSVGEKYDAWKSAEAGVPTDENLVAEYKDAVKKKEEAIKEFVEQERKASGGGVVKEVPSFPEMQAGITGEAKKVGPDWTRYENTLKPNYDAAVRTAKTTTEYTSIVGKRNNFASQLDAYYQEVFNAYSTKDPVAREKAIKALDRKLNFINREFVRLTDDEILEQAYKDGQMQKITNKKWYQTADYTRPWTDKAGNKHVEYYKFNDGVKLKDLKKAESARVQGLKEALRSEIEATHQEFVNAQQELNNFANRKEFNRKSRTGKKDSGNFVCNYSEIKGANLETLKKELDVVEKLKNGEKLTKAEKNIANALETKYGFNPKEIKGLAELQTTLSKRIPLVEEYVGLQETLKSSKGGAERIAGYNQELEQVLQRNKGVQDAAKEIKKLAKKYGINVEAAAEFNATEANTRALEKFNKSKAGEIFAELEGRYNAAAERSVDKKLVESTKAEWEKAAKELGAKYCKGKAKWMAPAAGALVLGLCALGFRPKAEA